MALDGFLLGLFVGGEVVLLGALWYSRQKDRNNNELNLFTRENVKKTAAEYVQSHHWTPSTVSSAMTNIFFEVDGTEYRAVLNVEEKERWEERTNDR